MLVFIQIYGFTHTYICIYKNYFVCILYTYISISIYISMHFIFFIYINVLVWVFLTNKTRQISYQLNKQHQCPLVHWCLWLKTESWTLDVNHLLWISLHTFSLHTERERKQKPCHIPSSWASGGKCHGTRSNSKQENENRKLLETGVGVS